MAEGYDVIYQPTFFDGRWMGRADFLLRVETPSARWPWGYEAADAKLARRVRSEAILQLCEYSAHIARLQGSAPASMQVILGDGVEHPYRLDEFSAYHANVKADFEAAMLVDQDTTYPDPVEHCGTCGFAARCIAQRKQDDHLSQVARMRSGQVLALKAVGISTMTALAELPDTVEAPERMSPTTFNELRAQAALQHQGPHPGGAPRHELLDAWEVGHGLCALPQPRQATFSSTWKATASLATCRSSISSAPSTRRARTTRGGVMTTPGNGRRSKDLWTLQSRSSVVIPTCTSITTPRTRRSALRRLMSRHGTREEEVDHLLRNEVLVDLYRVVRQGIRLSTDSYSLKKVERLYMPAREELIADAAGSLVMYERWLTSRDDGGDGDISLLEEIALYNERDCVSTAQLRDWLEGTPGGGGASARRADRTAAEIERDVKDTLHAKIVATQEVAAGLVDGLPLGPGAADCGGASPALLAPLLSYHRRENKVNWWRHFDQIAMSSEELERDTYALGPLEMIGAHEDGKRTIERYRFEPQEHRIGIGDNPLDPEADLAWAPVAGRSRNSTRRAARSPCRARLVRAERGAARFLIPSTPITTEVQEESLLDLGRWVVAHGADAPGPNRAGRDLLMRFPPRLTDGTDCGASRSRRDLVRCGDPLDSRPAGRLSSGAGPAGRGEDAHGGARGALAHQEQSRADRGDGGHPQRHSHAAGENRGVGAVARHDRSHAPSQGRRHRHRVSRSRGAMKQS